MFLAQLPELIKCWASCVQMLTGLEQIITAAHRDL